MVPTSITSVYRTYQPLPHPSPLPRICSTTPRLQRLDMLNSRCKGEMCEKEAVRQRQYSRSRTTFA